MSFFDEIKGHYTQAKRVVLLAQDNYEKNWYHLFSVIEILPEDTPDYNLPPSDGVWKIYKEDPLTSIVRSKNSKGKDPFSFYLAVHDLNSVESGSFLFESPYDKDELDNSKINYFNESFVQEPKGTSPLVLPSNYYQKEGLGSIFPKRQSNFFVWSKIDDKRAVFNRFYNENYSDEMKAISQLTNDWLGFDIWSKPEHIGNIYFIASNPFLRTTEFTLSTNPPGIFYFLKTRKEVNQTFYLRILDKHGDNIAFDKKFEVKKLRGLLELPHEPQLVEVWIYDKSENLIDLYGPFSFLRSIQMDVGVKQADLQVNMQKGNSEAKMMVEKFSYHDSIEIGAKKEFNQERYFKEAEETRQSVKNREQKDFIFLKGGVDQNERSKIREEAKEVIRELLNKAKYRCIICDPFFTPSDLIEFAFYVKNTSVDLKILGAKEHICKSQAKELLKVIEEYNEKPFQNIQCRILRGDKSILHDRFIISDRNVWFLGTSLNSIGSKATCIGRVPESDNIDIIKEVSKWFESDQYSQSLNNYAEEND